MILRRETKLALSKLEITTLSHSLHPLNGSGGAEPSLLYPKDISAYQRRAQAYHHPVTSLYVVQKQRVMLSPWLQQAGASRALEIKIILTGIKSRVLRVQTGCPKTTRPLLSLHCLPPMDHQNKIIITISVPQSGQTCPRIKTSWPVSSWELGSFLSTFAVP